jgi:hypothetical protein
MECDQSGLSDEIPVDDNNGIKSYQEFDQLNTLESNNFPYPIPVHDQYFVYYNFFSLKR